MSEHISKDNSMAKIFKPSLGDEMVAFCRLLVAASKTKLPFAIALEKFKSRSSGLAGDWIEELSDKLKNGYSVEEVSMRLKGLDPVIARLLPLIGNDRLIEVLDVYTRFLVKQEICRKQIGAFVLYPLVVMLIALFSICYLNFVNFPTMVELAESHLVLEGWIIRLFYFANLSYWPISLIMPGFLTYMTIDCLITMIKGEFGNASIWGKITGLKKVLDMNEKARLAAMISLYLSSGYSLDKALEVVATFLAEKEKQEVLEMQRALVAGNSVKESLTKSNILAKLLNGKESNEELAEKLKHCYEAINAEAMVILATTSERVFYIALIVAGLTVLLAASGFFGSYSALLRSLAL